MAELKQKDLMKYMLMILLFVIYTVCVPTGSAGNVSPLKIIIDIVFVTGALFAFKDEFKKGWKKTKKEPVKYLLIILGFWVLSVLASGLINNIIVSVLNVETPNNDAQRLLYQNSPIYLCFLMLICSPIIEELSLTIATRKVIKNKWFYLLASGILCGIMYVAFSASISYWFIASYFIQEVIWAFAYLKTENSFVPVGIHFLQNVMVIIGYMVLI